MGWVFVNDTIREVIHVLLEDGYEQYLEEIDGIGLDQETILVTNSTTLEVNYTQLMCLKVKNEVKDEPTEDEPLNEPPAKKVKFACQKQLRNDNEKAEKRKKSSINILSLIPVSL